MYIWAFQLLISIIFTFSTFKKYIICFQYIYPLCIFVSHSSLFKRLGRIGRELDFFFCSVFYFVKKSIKEYTVISPFIISLITKYTSVNELQPWQAICRPILPSECVGAHHRADPFNQSASWHLSKRVTEFLQTRAV